MANEQLSLAMLTGRCHELFEPRLVRRILVVQLDGPEVNHAQRHLLEVAAETVFTSCLTIVQSGSFLSASSHAKLLREVLVVEGSVPQIPHFAIAAANGQVLFGDAVRVVEQARTIQLAHESSLEVVEVCVFDFGTALVNLVRVQVLTVHLSGLGCFAYQYAAVEISAKHLSLAAARPA